MIRGTSPRALLLQGVFGLAGVGALIALPLTASRAVVPVPATQQGEKKVDPNEKKSDDDDPRKEIERIQRDIRRLQEQQRQQLEQQMRELRKAMQKLGQNGGFPVPAFPPPGAGQPGFPGFPGFPGAQPPMPPQMRPPNFEKRLTDVENKLDRLLREIQDLRKDLKGAAPQRVPGSTPSPPGRKDDK